MNDMASGIDFSAQFGGRDAAQVGLPHFRALKLAAKGLRLTSFPFKKLAFVLRVDGEANSYGLRGPGNLEFDKQGKYVSVDIGITPDDRESLEDRESNVLTRAIEKSPEMLSASGDARLTGTNYSELHETLHKLCARYLASL